MNKVKTWLTKQSPCPAKQPVRLKLTLNVSSTDVQHNSNLRNHQILPSLRTSPSLSVTLPRTCRYGTGWLFPRVSYLINGARAGSCTAHLSMGDVWCHRKKVTVLPNWLPNWWDLCSVWLQAERDSSQQGTLLIQGPHPPALAGRKHSCQKHHRH